jgi:hypothetical protein
MLRFMGLEVPLHCADGTVPDVDVVELRACLSVTGVKSPWNPSYRRRTRVSGRSGRARSSCRRCSGREWRTARLCLSTTSDLPAFFGPVATGEWR